MTGLDQNASRRGGVVSELNTSTTALGANETFTGEWERNSFEHFEIFRVTVDTAVENTVGFVDDIGLRLNETDVVYFEATSNKDNTVVNMRFSLNQYQNT